MGVGTEGCAQRRLFHAYARRLCALCAQAVRWSLSHGDIVLCSRSDVETDARDAALRAGFHTALGTAFLKKGLQKDAIAEYEHATRIFPRDFVARNNLAWLLATSSDASIRDGKRAIEVAEQTVQLSSGKDANYLRTLAAVYSEVGRFSEAIAVAQQAAALATMQGKTDVANRLKKDLVLLPRTGATSGNLSGKPVNPRP